MFERHSRDSVSSRLRLRGHDYSAPGSYFVTVCTDGRVCYFGDVEEDQMALSPAGVVIESWWWSIPRRFPGTLLDAMVLMPNHVHGIVMTGTDPEFSVFPLGEISGWFKSHSARDYGVGVRLEGWPRYDGHFWQQGYYDRIVRSDRELDRFRRYIAANPGLPIVCILAMILRKEARCP